MLVFGLTPLAAFVAAMVIEAKAKRALHVKLLCLSVIFFGIVAYALIIIPVFFRDFVSIYTAWWLTVLTALVGCSVLVVPYSTRNTKMLVALGTAVLLLSQFVMSHAS